MAVPTRVSGSTTTSSVGAGSYLLPTSWAQNDVLVFVYETANETASFPPSGWTSLVSLGTGTAGGTSATKLHICYRIATASESGLSVPDQGDHQLGLIFGYRGVDLVNPIDTTPTTSVEASGSTSVTLPSITTLTDDCLVVSYVVDATDTATLQAGSLSWAGVTSPTLGEVRTSVGNGGGISYVHAQKPTAGSTGSGSLTLTTSSVQVRATVAFRSATPPTTARPQVFVVT